MASRFDHSTTAEKILSQVKPGMDVQAAKILVDAAEVHAKLAMAAAIVDAATVIGENFKRIKTGY